MVHRTLIVTSCLIIAGVAAFLAWPSKKFISLATPVALSLKAERPSMQTTFDPTPVSHPVFSLDAAIRRWPRFAELAKNAQHPGFFVERSASDYAIISIGDKLGYRFHSWAMLRVWKSGLIEKVNLSTGMWAVEYHPEAL
jgi:hypothetical protein